MKMCLFCNHCCQQYSIIFFLHLNLLILLFLIFIYYFWQSSVYYILETPCNIFGSISFLRSSVFFPVPVAVKNPPEIFRQHQVQHNCCQDFPKGDSISANQITSFYFYLAFCCYFSGFYSDHRCSLSVVGCMITHHSEKLCSFFGMDSSFFRPHFTQVTRWIPAS